MKVCAISDTHGSAFAIRRALEAAKDADCFIHLGDTVRDARSLEALTGKPVYFVRGNCDAASDADSERVLTLCGARLLITHGHNYSVSASTINLAYRAEELGCSAALFGHTHMSLIEASGPLLIINPGSPALPRGGMKPSIAVLEIENGEIYPSIVTL